MFLLKTKNALRESRNHIDDTNAGGTPIESYLTQHILILLSADMQEALYEILTEKASQVKEEEIRTFVSSAGKACVRSAKKDAIAGFVGHFGKSHRNRFNEALED